MANGESSSLTISPRKNTDSTRTRHIVETFIAVYATTFRSIPTNFRGVVMIAIAKSSATVHPLLKQLHVFEDTIKVLPPNKEARKEILSHFVEQRMAASDLTKDESLNYAALATLTEGYAALDLKDLVSRAVHNAAERSLTDAGGVLDYAAVSVCHGSRVSIVLITPLCPAEADVSGLHRGSRGFRPALTPGCKPAKIHG